MVRVNLPKRRIRAKRFNRIFFWLALVFFIIVLLLGFHFCGAYNDLQNRAEWALALPGAPAGERGTNYLIYGIYEKEGELFLEDIFLLNFPLETDSPHIIFMPGKMLINRQGEQESSSSSPFYLPVYFYQEGGAQLLIEQLSYFLGAPIHYYLEIDYRGIPEMVDYCGGIPYKGHLLNGEDYYEYFLEEGVNEDPLPRALCRMEALGELVELIAGKRGIFNKSRSIRKAVPYLDTNISWKELENIYPSLAPLYDGTGEEARCLPGAWRRQIDGEDYFEPEYALITEMMGNLGKEFILPRELITVEVLNGSGVAGIAATAADILREEGFQVIGVDNAPSFDYSTSQVIARREEMGPAKEVAGVISGAELLKEKIDDFPAMVTVIIGKNFVLD